MMMMKRRLTKSRRVAVVLTITTAAVLCSSSVTVAQEQQQQRQLERLEAGSNTAVAGVTFQKRPGSLSEATVVVADGSTGPSSTDSSSSSQQTDAEFKASIQSAPKAQLVTQYAPGAQLNEGGIITAPAPSSAEPTHFPTRVPTVVPSSQPSGHQCSVFGYGGVCLDQEANFYDTCFGKLDEPDANLKTCMDLCVYEVGIDRCLGISYGITENIKYCYLHLSTPGDDVACKNTGLYFADYVTNGQGDIGRLYPYDGYKCYKCQ
jgi:hypothetical protein